MSGDAATIQGLIDRAERRLGLDRRTSWCRLTPRGGLLEARLSRGEVLEALAAELGAAPAAGAVAVEQGGYRLVLAGRGADDLHWAVVSVADVRRGPEHASELLTQAIMGETMNVLDRRGDWYFVMLEDGYHGWVRSWHLGAVRSESLQAFRAAASHRVGAPIAYVLGEPAAAALPVTDITAGSPVIRRGGEEEFTAVELPAGRSGFIERRALETPPDGRADGGRVTGRARRFLGIPYVWGGTSAKGFDCSGLVKLVFALEGIRMPRDADQQSAAGRPLPFEGVEAVPEGALLFFGEGGQVTHVAISCGTGRFIHACGDVRIGSLSGDDPLYEERLARTLLFARDVLER